VNETAEKQVIPTSPSSGNKPLPPNKPPRPAFGSSKVEPVLPAALTVKLRPINGNNSTASSNGVQNGSSSNNTSTSNGSTTNGTTTATASTNQIENKLLAKVNGANAASLDSKEHEKRSSVREIVQMMSSEESKVISFV
jgi:hypothetical protein